MNKILPKNRCESSQGGIEAKLGGTVWLPLTPDEQPDPGSGPFPDYTITNILELESLLPEILPPKMRSYRSQSYGSNGTSLPINRRIASLPDLDNHNSNSSDGS